MLDAAAESLATSGELRAGPPRERRGVRHPRSDNTWAKFTQPFRVESGWHLRDRTGPVTSSQRGEEHRHRCRRDSVRPPEACGAPHTRMPRPNLPFCYICGRQFGTASLAIHETQCAEKFLKAQSLLPRNERRPLPRKPQAAAPIGGQGAAIDQYNEEAFSAYKETLVPCQNCGRKFAQDRLPVHLRSCRPGNTAKPIGAPAGPSSAAIPKSSSIIRPSSSSGIPRAGSMALRGGGGGGSNFEDDGNEANLDLVQCQVCGRRFASDRISVHQNACAKSSKQRKVFDAGKHRVSGTEAAAYYKGTRSNVGPSKAQAKSTWRAQHSDFQKAVREARLITKYQKEGRDLRTLPPPSRSENPNYIQCRYCARRFAPEAHSRHEPRCATTVNKPPPPPHLRASGPTAAMLAPQRGGAMAQALAAQHSRQPTYTTPSLPKVTSALGSGPRQPPPRSPQPPKALSPQPSSMAGAMAGGGGGPARFCTGCGAGFGSAAKFCGQCGARRAGV